MKYVSTRGGIETLSSAQAIKKGIADNGGLFVPERIPALPDSLENLAKLSYRDLAMKTMGCFLDDYTEEELLSIFNAFCKPYGMKLSDEAENFVKAYLHWLVQHKSENFANGREMRNLFELSLSSQANRLAEKTEISDHKRT